MRDDTGRFCKISDKIIDGIEADYANLCPSPAKTFVWALGLPLLRLFLLEPVRKIQDKF
jgi:hypothetical protein